MSKEQYVTFEVAKLLKEKGFDWGCNGYWFISEYSKVFNISPSRNPQNWNEVKTDLDWLSCPTQQMACRWLRKEKGIHILPEISEVKENPKYYCMIWKTSTLESFIIELFDSYEDAVEVALEYALKNLI